MCQMYFIFLDFYCLLLCYYIRESFLHFEIDHPRQVLFQRAVNSKGQKYYFGTYHLTKMLLCYRFQIVSTDSLKEPVNYSASNFSAGILTKYCAMSMFFRQCGNLLFCSDCCSFLSWNIISKKYYILVKIKLFQ